MKRIILTILSACLGLTAAAQNSESFTDTNEYGQSVVAHRLTPEVQDGILVLKNDNIGYRFWFDVRVQADGAVFFGNDKDYDPIGNGMNIRRARFAVKGKFDDKWYGELDTDWTSGTLELKDALIAYTGLPYTEFRVGNFKENFSIQRNTSSRYLTFMERPMVTALAPSRHLGINATFAKDWLYASAGVFGPELKGAEEMETMEDYNKDFGYDEGLSYTGKVAYRPLYKLKDAALHIGAAFSYREPKLTSTDGYRVARYSSRNSTSINRKKYLDTDVIKGVDHEIAYTFELAGYWKALRYEGAYIARSAILDRSVNDKGPQTADGWYVQASWLLFGGEHSYDSDRGKFNKITRGRGWGDLEYCLRYESCDFNTADYFGGSADALTVGLNYYPSANVKIMLNYQFNNNDRYANGKGKYYIGHDASGKPTKDYKKVTEEAGKGGVDYNMVALRFQISF